MNIEIGKVYSIDIRFIDFPIGIPSNTDPHLIFKGEDLLHAIATCGVYHPIGQASAEFLYKKYAIECQLEEHSGELFLSKEYKNYDQSEKNCLSYYRGMVFGRLIADLRFDLTYFVHLSKFKKYNTIHYVSDKRPDIIGWNRRYITKYYVWECKGFRDALSEGKEQARAISVINYWDVERQIASAVYPTKVLGKIHAQVKDPELRGENIDIDLNEALEIYYSPFIKMLELADSQYERNGIQFGKMILENEEYTFGIAQKIYGYFLDDSKNNPDRKTLEQIVKECSDDPSYNSYSIVGKSFDDFIYIS